jgi:hypothetical protein
MKQKLLLVIAVAFLFAACNNEKKEDSKTEKSKDSTPKNEPYTMPDSATMMKAMMEYGTPGDMHKMMASWDGTWNGEITMWEKPGAPPTSSTGTAVCKTVLNGLYQESVHTGNMMGMPFEGHSTLAYDNAKKMFINTWIDNFGSGIMIMKGTWDAATNSMTLTGTSYNPALGRDCNFREVFKVVDDNTQQMEMYGPAPDGSEMKMMEIKSTRKK